MRPSSRRPRAVLAVLAAVVLAVVLVVIYDGDSEAGTRLDEFVAAWEAERHAEAASMTDSPPTEVEQALDNNQNGLDGARLDAQVSEFEEEGDEARADVRMRWDIPVIGLFEYGSEIRLRRIDGEWRVAWSEQVVHPELEPEQRLGTVRVFEERAPILDRRGRKLVIERPVVDVGIVPKEIEDRETAIGAIAENTGADPGPVRSALRTAAPKQFVVAITLREQEFVAIRDQLEGVPGVEFANRTLPLAPSREFARALLGTVGPVTEEQLDELDDPYAPGDQVGQWGLQAVFERRLAGTPTARVVIRNEDGIPLSTLHEVEGEPGDPLRTTLDVRIQQAAEEALGDRSGKAALVAIDAASGDILAAANRPVENTFDRALAGQYPPGSTFKVVTTAALLEAGLDPSETVDCPARITVGGREFRNFEGTARGAVPFREDFIESCNTAFVSLSSRLDPGALAETAEQFGLGREYELPVAHFAGSVPEPESTVERAEAIIGQARVLASPLAMSGVAGTVASGRWHQPRLVDADPVEAASRLAPETRRTLRSLMSGVVESGTGAAAAAVEGPLAGKTGTAEHGSGNPPPTHAWFIAFRGDLALAVLIEDAPSGGAVAAPVAAAFFAALD